MNTNNNFYTVIYTTVIVVVVAAILAFVSQSLKQRQEDNEKADTIAQMMTAAGFGTKAEFQAMGNAAVIDKYAAEIDKAYLVGVSGEKVEDLGQNEVFSPSRLKAQNYLLKGDRASARIPVFEFKKDGIRVVPIYGAGLWGPVWGYIALAKDNTIIGAYFDHESETAGLGAKIKDDPAFQAEFKGAIPEFTSENVFEIVKGGAPHDAEGNDIADNKIDAITGATMTSQGLEKAIDIWLAAYAKYFTGSQIAPSAPLVQEDSVTVLSGEAAGEVEKSNKKEE